MPTTEIASPFRNLPIYPGGGVTFGDFSVRFIVDEDLKIIIPFILGCVMSVTLTKWHVTTPENDIYQRTITLLQVIQPRICYRLQNLFPVALTNLQFDATITDVEYITAEVTFKHQQFFIRDKNMQI